MLAWPNRKCLTVTPTEHGFAARAYDRPMGRRGAAHRTCTRGGAAGSRADGHHGRRGEHCSLHGRAADDGAVPAAARDGSGDLGRYRQLSDRVELSRGELGVDTRPRASPRSYVLSPSLNRRKHCSDPPSFDPTFSRLFYFMGVFWCLFFSGNPATAAAWRQQTFSVAVEFLPTQAAQMVRKIFEENMPLLAALLPDSADDPLGTRGVLEEAFTFSCMLRGGTNADGDVLYRSFVPKIASTLDTGMVELVKPCRLSERGEVDRVGATIFPGLFEVLPAPSMVQTVVRPAQVICECELLETTSGDPSSPLT
jgi:hypothetical protein